MRGPGPDWRREEAAPNPVWDLGELAARAAQGVGIDRAGQVAFSTSFNHGTGSEFLLQPAGGSIAADNTRSSRGSHSLKLTTAATINSPCIAERFWFPLQSDRPVGQEVAVDLNGQADADFDIGITAGIGPQSNRVYTGRLRIKLLGGDRTLQYLDNTFAYQTLATMPWFPSSTYYWHSFKLVVNPWTGKYVRAVIDYLRIDMSAINMYFESALNYYFDAFFVLTNRVAAAKAVYVDDVILTGNEPA
jgi:hypothetical protein